MARMIPSSGPISNASYVAEPAIYRGLAEQLSDDFTVIHSLPWLSQVAAEIDGRAAPTGEIDFLLLHPRLGILAIEVKGGILRYEHPHFVLTRTGKQIDPITQVRRGAHQLAYRLTEAGAVYYFKIGYALAFPESAMQGKPIPPALEDVTGGQPENICIDRLSLPRIGERVKEIMLYWKRTLKTRDLTREAIERAVALLCPIVDYTPRWTDRIKEDTERWLLLTPQQSRELEKLAGRERVVLTGRSGTGKTLLACARARQLAEQGQRVLFLVYNVPLAVRLRADLADTSIQVMNFHRLCRLAAERMGATEEEMSADEWYKGGAPQALAAAIQTGKLAPYDALVIDETQVIHLDWLASLAHWFKGKPILACCDETQVFPFEECSPAKDIAEVIGAGEPQLLTVNMRSPLAVFDRLQQAFPTPYQQVSFRENEPDALVEYIESDPLERLHTVLKQLHEEGIPPQCILVVYNTREPPNYRPGVELLAKQTLSVYRARGLEAPVVIVWSSQFLHDHMLASAYSRATSRCIAIYSLQGLIPGQVGREIAAGVFYQNLRDAAQTEIEARWPPQKQFRLTPVVTDSAEVFWSHDWGGWFINSPSLFSDEEEQRKGIANELWAMHLLASSDVPVYALRATDRWVYRYDPLYSLSDALSYEGLQLGWCDQCQWWGRIQKGSVPGHYYCMECMEGKQFLPAPEAIQKLRQRDKALIDPSYKLETDDMSIFLLALKLWHTLPHEQQLQVVRIARSPLLGNPVRGVCKLLVGMRVVKTLPGDLVELLPLRMNYWQKCPWLEAHISREKWNVHMSSSVGVWIMHGWMEKIGKGVYRRLSPSEPAPHFEPGEGQA